MSGRWRCRRSGRRCLLRSLLPIASVSAAVVVLSAIDIADGGDVAVADAPRGDGGTGVPPRRRGANAVEIREDIQRRVAVAGGNSEGVLVASLSWITPDDLDLHVQVPGGTEINYRSRKAAGGELDVDMCVSGKPSPMCTERPVENVVFADEAPEGRYKVYVQNYNFHAKVLPEHMQVARIQERRKAIKEEQQLRLGRERPVLFELLVKVEGTYKLFTGLCTPSGKTHTDSNVPVVEFDYLPGAAREEDRVKLVFEAASDSEACREYQQKLLSYASDEERPFLEGPSHLQRRLPPNGAGKPKASALENLAKYSVHAPSPGSKAAKSRAGSAAAATASAGSGSSRAKPSGRRKGRQAEGERRAMAATQAVLGASRDALLAKPAKALRELLSDMGAECRGCMEKSELVDRLMSVSSGGSSSGGGRRGEL